MPELRFSADDGFDFAVRCLLTGVGYAMAEPGEVLATAAGVPAGDLDGWFDAWTALGVRSDAVGAEAAARGHRASAADAFLRAANYRFAGFYYVLATSDPGRHRAAWEAHRRSLLASWEHGDHHVQAFDVPWGDASLPAWLARTAGGGGAGRPLMLIHGGLASPLSDAVMTGLADGVRRGWDVVVFDGPGQGRVAVVDGVGPVDDWGAVGAAVLDAVLDLDGVDPGRVVAAGIADGGYLAARHAAADRRVAALVCDPGVLRPLDGAVGGLPEPLRAAWRVGGGEAVDRAVAAADGDPEVAFAAAKVAEQWPGLRAGEVLERLRGWDLTPALPSITVPTLVCDPDRAMSFPGQSAELAAALGAARSIPFTTAEAAGLDCEILAPRLRNQRVFDGLDEILAR